MPQAPEYITVTNAAGSPVAFLSPEADGITDCQIDRQLNGACDLNFKLPLTSAKTGELLPERLISAGSRVFLLMAPSCIRKVREGRKVWFEVSAPERWVELAKAYVTVHNDVELTPPWGTVSILASDLGQGGYSAGSAGSALYRLLSGSGWAVGTVDVVGTYDLETERQNLLENIQQVQKLWDGYLDWDSANKTVSLRDETSWQPGSGVQIRYAKNLKGVEREVDADLTTRLYVFGQDDLTIASVNAGSLYLTDTHYTATVYEGIYRNQEIDDPSQLKAKALKVLAELSEPRVAYRVNLVDLSALPEYAHEEFGAGDVVRVIDPEMNIVGNVRVIRHRYDVFQPWKATVDLGKPAESLEAMIASGRRAGDFVERVLKPNPSTSSLLKGFVNTFMTTINSANGKLVWSDAALDAIEVDGLGVETGKRVRITPGGIGISTDFGVTFATALTGQGILANRIIVSDLYALASDDGYTKVKGDGLHVFDALAQERVHVGRWLIGAVEHYGIRIFANDGTVLLDDRGSLQTWERGFPDNVDATHPHRIKFYLPPETLDIKKVLLRFSLEAFRAYETGAASADLGTVSISTSTTAAGGGSTTGPSSITTTGPSLTTTSGPSSTSVTSENLHQHTFGDAPTDSADGTVGLHTHHMPIDTTWATGSHSHGMDHTHEIPSHTHNLDHYHSVSSHIHDMSHSHTIGSHSHAMVFGIYEGAAATGITVKINGVDRTAVLGGPFTADQLNLNIAAYVTVGATNVVELGASGLGRIDASVFLQVLMGT